MDAFLGILAVMISPLTYLFRKVFIRGKIDIKLSPILKIGCTQEGPRITLGGTIRALNLTLFVNSISLNVTPNVGKEKHEYTLHGLQRGAPNLTFTNLSLTQFSGFLIQKDESQEFCAKFYDHKIRAGIVKVLSKSRTVLEEIKTDIPVNTDALHFEDELLDNEERVEKAYVSDDRIVNARKDIADSFYWTSGKYQLEVFVNTRKPNSKIRVRFAFSIDATQEEKMNTGIDEIINIPFLEEFKRSLPVFDSVEIEHRGRI